MDLVIKRETKVRTIVSGICIVFFYGLVQAGYAKNFDTSQIGPFHLITPEQSKEFIGATHACQSQVIAKHTGGLIGLFVDKRFLLANIEEPKSFLIKSRQIENRMPKITFNHFKSSQVRYQIDISLKSKKSIKCDRPENCERFNAELELMEELNTSQGAKKNVLITMPVFVDDYCLGRVDQFFYTENILERALKGLLRH